MQVCDLWSVYGKSLKPVDSCQRRFTATLNRAKVFESVIVRTLCQSNTGSDTSQRPDDNNVSCGGRQVAVMLNCSVPTLNDRDNMTVTELRQVLVSQHICALLTAARCVLVSRYY